jgi:hypothetical protein
MSRRKHLNTDTAQKTSKNNNSNIQNQSNSSFRSNSSTLTPPLPPTTTPTTIINDGTSTGNNILINTQEEKLKDCIYQVTIHKVFNKNVETPSNHDTTDNSSNIYPSRDFRSYLDDFNNSISVVDRSINTNAVPRDGKVYSLVKVRKLKAATLPKFIEQLTNEQTGEIDSKLVQTFLATYRPFTKTKEAISLLRARYEAILPASLEMTEDLRIKHLESIKKIFYMWLDRYPEDFNEPPDYPHLNQLNAFAFKYSTDNDILCKFIQQKYDEFERSNYLNSNVFEFTTPVLRVQKGFLILIIFLVFFFSFFKFK